MTLKNDRNTSKRPRTPSTEIMSDDDAPVNPRTISPKSTSMLARNYRNYQRNFNKKKNRVKVHRGEEKESKEPSDSDYEEDERDSKMSKKKKNQRQ